MPRSGNPLQYNYGKYSSKTTEPYYSNEDIKILHQIVLKAQTLLSPTILPSNALFTAYFSTLEELQVHPDHDNRYARILFKIGGIRGVGSLLEKFENVISEMGIEIEFDQLSEEEEETEFHRIKTSLENFSTKFTFKTQPQYAQTSEKCNSEILEKDPNAEDTLQMQRRRINSFSSYPLSKAEFDGKNEYTPQRNKLQQFRGNSIYECPQGAQNARNFQHVGAWLASGPFHLPTTSISSRYGFQINKDTRKITNSRQNQVSLPASTDFHIASMTTPPSSPFDEETTVHSTGSSPKEFIQESETLLDIEASLIRNRHFALFVKSNLQSWKNQAIKLHNNSNKLSFIATNQYLNNILCSALHDWLDKVRNKRKERCNERYFNHLEISAKKARDLYLLYVSFSHWSNFTMERIQLTAKTRKHIIQNRMFNAWRDITAVDELKVKRQILKRIFFTLKSHHSSIKEKIKAANISYKSNITQKYFNTWIHKFLTIRIITWRTENLVNLILTEWISKSRFIGNQKNIAEISRQKKICVNTIVFWILRTKKSLEEEERARQFYINKISKNYTRKLCKEAVLMTAKNKIQNQIVLRQVGNIFSFWINQARNERIAIATDRMRILHEALTNWRYKTRALLFRLKLDNCIIERTIYTWILCARTNLAIRIRDENYLRDMTHLWNLKFQALKKNHSQQETLAREVLARRMKNFVLLRWYSCMGRLPQAKMLDLSPYKPRILKFFIQKWINDIQHLHKLERWSHDAGFFLLVSRIMRRWKSATERTRRNKRKYLYARVRRMTKMNLARHVLRIWARKTGNILYLKSQVTEINQSRMIFLKKYIFYSWHCYNDELLELKIMWQKNSLQKYVANWQDKTKNILALGLEAIIIYKESQISKILKKWSLRSLHVRAYENSATEIHDKKTRKKMRKLIIFWHQQVSLQKTAKSQVLSESDLEKIAQDEAWSELGEESNVENIEKILNREIIPSFVPAYLNTPSKRAERIKAAVAKYSKTPKTPLPISQDQEIRVMRSGGLFSSIQKKRTSNLRMSDNNIK